MLVPGGAKAGIITKPYGLRGEVYGILEPEAGQHIETDHPLFIELDGQRVPFFVEEVELLSVEQAIIKFEYIDTPEDARKISGCPIYFDSRRPAGSPEIGEDLSDLIGFSATDQASGLNGKITDYMPHPMNPVFLIQAEGKGREGVDGTCRTEFY